MAARGLAGFLFVLLLVNVVAELHGHYVLSPRRRASYTTVGQVSAPYSFPPQVQAGALNALRRRMLQQVQQTENKVVACIRACAPPSDECARRCTM